MTIQKTNCIGGSQLIKLYNNTIKIPFDYWKGNLESKKEYLASKIITEAFDLKKVSMVHDWKLFFGERVCLNINNKEIVLPKTISFEEFCYILRVIIDGIMVLDGRCPIHASAVNTLEGNIIMSAKSKEGKSYCAHRLENECNGTHLIGDDHLIISNGTISGNSFMRIREEESSYIVKKTLSYDFCERQIIVMIHSDKNSIKTISGKEDKINIFFKSELSKYLLKPFTIGKQNYVCSDLFESSIKDKYIDCLNKIFEEVILISGDGDFIYANVKKILEGKIL